MRSFLAYTFLILSLATPAQSWQWAVDTYSKKALWPAGITLDGYGNSYLAGYARAQTLFGGLSVDSGCFIVKYKPNGNAARAQNIAFGPQRMVADAVGNLYLMSNFKGTVVTSQTTLTSKGENDFFILKLDAAGKEEWVKSYGGTADDLCDGLVCDGNGNIYVSGSIGGDTLDFGNEILIDTLSKGKFFLARIDAAGSTDWVTRGLQDDTVFYYRGGDLALGINNSLNVLATGSACQNCNTDFIGRFNRDDGTLTSSSTILNYKGYYYWKGHFNRILGDDQGNVFIRGTGYRYNYGGITKYDSTAKPLWSFALGSHGSCKSYGDYAVDGPGNLYVSGTMPPKVSTCYSNSPSFEALVTKVKPDGTPDWDKTSTGNGAEVAIWMTVDKIGNCHVSGTYNGVGYWSNPGNLNEPVWFDHHTFKASTGVDQIFVAKIGSTHPLAALPDKTSAGSYPFVFPNPSNGEIWVKRDLENGSLIVSDIHGRIVSKFTLDSGTTKINLGNLPRGIYLVELNSEDKIHLNKLVIY
jgi:hypothetical protein